MSFRESVSWLCMAGKEGDKTQELVSDNPMEYLIVSQKNDDLTKLKYFAENK